jgi:hypothetical protein
MKALVEEDTPKTLLDKFKGVFTTIGNTPGNMRDRWRDAKRLSEVRNQIAFSGKGGDSRGGGWAFRKLFKGDTDYQGLVNATMKQINTGAYDEGTKRDLLEKLRPEETRRQAAAQQKAEASRPHPEISGVMDPDTLAAARQMSFGALSVIMHGGKFNKTGVDGSPDERVYPDPVWDAYVAAFREKLELMAAQALGRTA